MDRGWANKLLGETNIVYGFVGTILGFLIINDGAIGGWKKCC
jgi:ascorbate-specific PTS system EIIC-type component UlaA